MAYSKYDKYKDSGIPWLGEIPEHWKKIRLKFHTKITTGNKNTEDKEKDGKFNFYVRSQKVEKINTYSFEGEGILTAGDGVGVGKVFHYVNEKFDFHQRVYLFYNFSFNVYGKFLFYYLREKLVVDLKLYNAKSTVDSVRLPTLKEFVVITPSLQEQTTIASFLDYKTEKIDRFIKKKKQLIELLKEQKAAIINQAVTKGLNPNVPMKDSGIEWLGEIPEHWEVRKLKGITSIISKGTTPNTIGKNTISNGVIRFLKAENIGFDNKVNPHPENFIDFETNELLKRSQLQAKDILFVIAGATIGKVAILHESFIPSNTNQAVSFIRLLNLKNVPFVWYWIQSEFIKQLLWLEAVQSAQPNLAMGKLANFPILLPPLSEQQLIVSFIESETQKLDKTIATIEKEIALVEEYKTALIAEAVTGKIDVRDFIIPKEETPLAMVAEDYTNYNKN